LVAAGLFAGIGGFELGLAHAGCEVALLCENWPPARAVLEARFPKVPLAGDIRELKALPKDVNLVCAGFPCQDLSSVGEKEGIRGARSSLVGEVFRLLKRSTVEWVLLENVPFMLQLNRGQAMHAIRSALEQLGYTWAYRILDSQAFGVPHRRRRVYLVAARNADPRGVLLVDDVPPPPPREPTLDLPLGFYWTEGTYAVGLAVDAIPPLKNGSTIGIPSPPAILMPDGRVVLPDVRDGERLQGFPADWTKPAEVVARPSLRWSLVGSAVTVNAVHWLVQKLPVPGEYRPSTSVPLRDGEKWPLAAWGRDGMRFRAAISDWPLRPKKRTGLRQFLRFPTKPLTTRATIGFVKRARAGGLQFPAGFLRSLERHVCRIIHEADSERSDESLTRARADEFMGLSRDPR
jgi:DNA (cytosine-5)-methyltransferase 1